MFFFVNFNYFILLFCLCILSNVLIDFGWDLGCVFREKRREDLGDNVIWVELNSKILSFEDV